MGSDEGISTHELTNFNRRSWSPSFVRSVSFCRSKERSTCSRRRAPPPPCAAAASVIYCRHDAIDAVAHFRYESIHTTRNPTSSVQSVDRPPDGSSCFAIRLRNRRTDGHTHTCLDALRAVAAAMLHAARAFVRSLAAEIIRKLISVCVSDLSYTQPVKQLSEAVSLV